VTTPHETPVSRPPLKEIPAGEIPAGEIPAAFTPSQSAVLARFGDHLVKTLLPVLSQLPSAMAGEIVRALAQAPPENTDLCASCIDGRTDWDDANADATDFAQAQLAAAAQASPGERFDLETFLPEEVRADPADPFPADGIRMPYVLAAVTTRGGWRLCPYHAADSARATRQQRGKQAQSAALRNAAAGQQAPAQLLVPPPGMNATQAARIAGQGIPQ
jgi:hypothetical protein